MVVLSLGIHCYNMHYYKIGQKSQSKGHKKEGHVFLNHIYAVFVSYVEKTQ